MSRLPEDLDQYQMSLLNKIKTAHSSLNLLQHIGSAEKSMDRCSLNIQPIRIKKQENLHILNLVLM